MASKPRASLLAKVKLLIRKMEPVEREPLMEGLQAELAHFKAELVKCAQPDAEWRCNKCGHVLDHDGWLSPRTLREQVPHEHGQGSVLSIALMDLVRDGVFEQNTHWQVRLAGKST